MIIKQISTEFRDFGDFRRMYYSSFPKNERTPYKLLKNMILYYKNFEAYAIYDGGMLKGFCVLANYNSISHILFIAIGKQHRNKGYGSKLINYICKEKKDCIVLADLEYPNNDSTRQNRINFYVKNGFLPSDINYTWNNEKFVIYKRNGNIKEKDFWDFFKYLQSEYNLPDEYI